MIRSADISEDGLYRYSLTRCWGADTAGGTLGWIMLNPSTADADVDDPTIRRCIGFSKREGYSKMIVMNVYAYRATNPRELLTAADPHGPLNLDKIMEDLIPQCWKTVCAWGAGIAGKPRRRAPMTLAAIVETGSWNAQCLGTTKDGHPRHPLYVRADQPFERYPKR